MNKKLSEQLLSPSIYLSKCQTMDTNSKLSIPFQDRTHLPFYYYLGKSFPAENILVIGLGLGLEITSLLMSRPSTINILAIQDKTEEYYSQRLAFRNIRTATRIVPEFHYGNYHDEAFVNAVRSRKWEICIICGKYNYDELMSMMTFCFDNLKDDGVMTIERVRSEPRPFNNFCKVCNREGFQVNSRYGHGLIFK